MIHGYVEVKGEKYFCGTGNTKRTACAVAEGNARLVGDEIGMPDLEHKVIYSKAFKVLGYPNIAELVIN